MDMKAINGKLFSRTAVRYSINTRDPTRPSRAGKAARPLSDMFVREMKPLARGPFDILRSNVN
jgi:hypothetical protein